MAKMTYSNNQLTDPAWCQNPLTGEYLLPGGFKVDAAQFAAGPDGKKRIQAGTLLGRTFAERDAGAKFGPAADADDEVLILAFDVTDAVQNDDCTLVNPEMAVIFENRLPGWGSLSATLKGKLRAAYTTIVR